MARHSSFTNTNLYSQSSSSSRWSSYFQPTKLLKKAKPAASSRILGALSFMTVLALLLCALISTISTLVWIFKHLQCYSREATVVWKEGAAHDMPRACPAVPYLTKLSTKMMYSISKRNICITTLSDAASIEGTTVTTTSSATDTKDTAGTNLRKASSSSSSSSWWHRWIIRCRNFDTVAKLTWPNHAEYARRQGYTIRDQSARLDPSRPPAWSKIKAVQAMMDKPYTCEWTLWLDADTVIMDSSRLLESLIPHAGSSGIDLIVTTDRRFTANSGVWLIRNTDWSRQFLQDWWNSNSFVRPNGLSLSGDNDAFGHLIRHRLGLGDVDASTLTEANVREAIETTSSPIRLIPRCNMNSFGVFVPKVAKMANGTISDASIEQQEWYQSDQWYHDGDFIAHASGIDQKAAGVQMLLQRAK